jgi:phospholipid/cholesterol/gamma-HCH transport system substrate-binding protein
MAEFKVGLLVLTVGSLIAFMSMQVSDDPSYLGRSKKAWFLLPNAAGLIKNSAIKSAGIPIGVIKNIRLQDGQARIDITVKSDVNLTTSAAVEIKSSGILGDKYVEVYPGAPEDPPLPEGAQILNVRDSGSLDNLIGKVGEITDSLKSVSEALKESVSDDGTRKHILGRIVKNVEKLTGDLADMTGQNKEKINEIVDQVHNITGTLDEMVNDQSDQGLQKSWKRALARIDSTLKNVDEIAGKINRGEGTIGKLVNDDTTVEEINTAVQGVNNLLGTADRIQTSFDFHGEYLTRSDISATKSYIGVKIQPGLDRYYYVAIVDDPAGVVETTRTETTLGGSNSSSEFTEKKTYLNKTKLTVLYAKNFYDFTIRGGLMENTGGIGFDYAFFKKKLKLSLDAFNFSSVNIRPSVQYNLFHGLYLVGGVNDALDKSEIRSSYLGAGLFLTNDDLKLLLSRSPF